MMTIEEFSDLWGTMCVTLGIKVNVKQRDEYYDVMKKWSEKDWKEVWKALRTDYDSYGKVPPLKAFMDVYKNLLVQKRQEQKREKRKTDDIDWEKQKEINRRGAMWCRYAILESYQRLQAEGRTGMFSARDIIDIKKKINRDERPGDRESYEKQKQYHKDNPELLAHEVFPESIHREIQEDLQR